MFFLLMSFHDCLCCLGDRGKQKKLAFGRSYPRQICHQDEPRIEVEEEARKTTILQPVDQKPQLQKDREDEKAEGYVPDEGTRKNPRKTTK